MTIVHDLYPSAPVREALLRANDGEGFEGLKEAAAMCRSPSELRYVVLGFKGWRHAGGSGLDGVTRVWGDMVSMSGVLMRVKAASAFDPPGGPLPDSIAEQPAAQRSASSGLNLQGGESALADAFAASVALQGKRDQAPIHLGIWQERLSDWTRHV